MRLVVVATSPTPRWGVDVCLQMVNTTLSSGLIGGTVVGCQNFGLLFVVGLAVPFGQKAMGLLPLRRLIALLIAVSRWAYGCCTAGGTVRHAQLSGTVQRSGLLFTFQRPLMA